MFMQLKRIKEIDRSAEEAIADYGKFVDHIEWLQNKVRREARFLGTSWSQAIKDLASAKNAIPAFHKAIADKFGDDAMFEAIRTHPIQ